MSRGPNLPLLFLLLITLSLAYRTTHIVDFSLKLNEPRPVKAINFVDSERRIVAKWGRWDANITKSVQGHVRIPMDKMMVVFQMKDAGIVQNEAIMKLGSPNPSFLSIQSNDYRLKLSSKSVEIENSYKYQNSSTPENDGGCACVQGNCACCLAISIPEFEHSICVNATYNPVSIGLDLSIGVDGHYFSEEISLRNPPPFCFTPPIPGAEHIAGLCVAFTNLDINKQEKILSGCVDFEVELIHFRVLHFKIGCFRMPI